MQIEEEDLDSLRVLALKFEVMSLVKQCEAVADRFKLNKKLFDSGKCVNLSFPSSRPHSPVFPFGLPINLQKLREVLQSGEFSDVNICIEDHGLTTQLHRIILSLWSVPFAKVSQMLSFQSSFDVPLFIVFFCIMYALVGLDFLFNDRVIFLLFHNTS